MTERKGSRMTGGFDLDGTEQAHKAIQESYEVGATGASLNDVGYSDGTMDEPDAYDVEVDQGVSRMMGEGGVAPPENPEDWREWAKRRQPGEGDKYGKM